MLIFYLITLVVLGSLGFVFYTIWKEQFDEAAPIKKDDNVTAAGLLDRLGLDSIEKKEQNANPKKSFLSGLVPQKPQINADNDTKDAPQSGTASMRLDNTDNAAIETEVELSIKNDELQKKINEINEKAEKLESLLSEKSATLDKTQKELEQELKHRKEFNKVKDLLEKELKDEKDTSRKFQAQLDAVKVEGQTYTNRITQLEEKIKTLEKSYQEKSSTIEEQQQIIKSLQAQKPKNIANQNNDTAVKTLTSETQTVEEIPIEPMQAEKNIDGRTEPTPEKTAEIEKTEPASVDQRSQPGIDESTLSDTPAKDISHILDQLSIENTGSPKNEAPEKPQLTEQHIEETKTIETLDRKDQMAAENDAIKREEPPQLDLSENKKIDPPEGLSNPLELNPVSNLEDDYEDMAAPLSKKIPARNFAENEPMTEMLKEKDHDHISKDIIDESRNPDEKESNVDDFLKEHLNLVDPGSADESGKEEKSENIQKAADPIEQQDDEMHNEIDETETAPFANSSEGPSENSKEQAPPSDDKESPSAENKSLNDDEKSVQKKPRLGPDIFKDIEEQFRKIEEEMHITDEDQNINTNEENDQDSGKE